MRYRGDGYVQEEQQEKSEEAGAVFALGAVVEERVGTCWGAEGVEGLRRKGN